MSNEVLIYLSLGGVAALIVVLMISEIRRRKTIVRNPQPVLIVFKDPFGLATGFQYVLNPNQGRKESFGNMEFIMENGQETPPEHRVFELEDGRQGDTLRVTWKLRDGSPVADTTVLPQLASSLGVTLTQTRTILFE